MMKVRASGKPFHRDCTRIVRMERSSYVDLSHRDGKFSHVGRIYRNGFDLVLEGCQFLHFQNGDLLASPFSVILDQPVRLWMRGVSLRENDVFLIRGDMLFREGNGDARIDFGGASTPDLGKRIPWAVADDEIGRWILLLSDSVCVYGQFNGVGGSLLLLREEMPGGSRFCPSVILNLWSRQAISVLRGCLNGLRGGNGESFEALWDGFLGLGPGLTTSGDDFLVGFLSAHRFLSSPFFSLLDDPAIRRDLKRKASLGTNEVGCRFLGCALEGLFSENIQHLFAELRNRAEGEATRRHVKNCIHWGHSSGTDVMTGILFGLLTLRENEGGKNGLGADIRH